MKPPANLTIYQHVFPKRSIERFGDANGKVCVRTLKNKKIIPNVSPANRGLFCASRIWDQRAESWWMKQIEDEFQSVADRISSGRHMLRPEDHDSVSRFFALWHLRATRKHQPEPDHAAKGVTGLPKELEAELGETLEKSGVLFIRSDGKISGRAVLGMQLQKNIDILMDNNFAKSEWGILEAVKGEFIVPDYISLDLQVVPVCPKICLIIGQGNLLLPASHVAQINSSLAAVAREYMIARDFTNCPFR